MSGAKIGRAERATKGGMLGPGPGAYDSNAYRNKGSTEVRIGSAQRSQFGKG